MEEILIVSRHLVIQSGVCHYLVLFCYFEVTKYYQKYHINEKTRVFTWPLRYQAFSFDSSNSITISA